MQGSSVVEIRGLPVLNAPVEREGEKGGGLVLFIGEGERWKDEGK